LIKTREEPNVSKIVFVDTETTSLRPDRRAWDVALIIREPGQEDREHQWFVTAEDIDLGNADPFALRIGHFYERHPGGQTADYFVEGDEPEGFVMRQVEILTRGAHLVGAVPNFDADVLGTRMRAHGVLPSWHYHLQDVETLAVGYLTALKAFVPESPEIAGLTPGQLATLGDLPWDSEFLSVALGVPVPSGADRHTAIGDARWARDMYDAVMGER
jgi:DNA polymerase III epsilon subunit-like protein